MEYKVFVINVDSKTARMERMRAVLQELSLPIERIRALTPDELPVKYSFSPIFNRALSVPELSCFYSHMEAWGKIANGCAPFALVLEDDVVLSPKVVPFLENLKQSTLNFDIIRLEHPQKGETFLTDKIEEIGGFEVGHLLSKAMCAAALVISKEGARKLLQLSKPVLPIDELLFNYYSSIFSQLNIFQTVDVLAWQLDNFDLSIPEKLESSILESRRKSKRKKSVLVGFKKLTLKLHYLLKLREYEYRAVPIRVTEKESLRRKEMNRLDKSNDFI